MKTHQKDLMLDVSNVCMNNEQCAVNILNARLVFGHCVVHFTVRTLLDGTQSS